MTEVQKRILIVDDDDEIRELLEFDIASSGYFVDTAVNGLEGLNKALNNTYDLILLDVMMPKMNGFEVCKNIRQAKLAVPVLMLTAKGTIDDKTTGFDCGADDYLVKPFDIQEVLLRIRVLLRRNVVNFEESPLSNEVLKCGDIEIFPESLEAVIVNQRVKLTPTEFEILYCLMQHFNSPVTLATLLDEVWGYDSNAELNVVWVYISYLRKKLTSLQANVQIKASRNAGYSLEGQGLGGTE